LRFRAMEGSESVLGLELAQYITARTSGHSHNGVSLYEPLLSRSLTLSLYWQPISTTCCHSIQPIWSGPCFLPSKKVPGLLPDFGMASHPRGASSTCMVVTVAAISAVSLPLSPSSPVPSLLRLSFLHHSSYSLRLPFPLWLLLSCSSSSPFSSHSFTLLLIHIFFP
jgi:hypothetical protein